MSESVLIAILLLAFSSLALLGWFTFRPGGLLERLMFLRDETLNSIAEAVKFHNMKMSKIEAEAERLEQVCTDLRDAVNRRMTSVEATVGKRNKKSELEELRNELFQSLSSNKEVVIHD